MKTLMRTMTALMMVAVGVGFMGCKHSVTPDFTGPQYIEFGMWPQTKLADESIITDTENTEKYRGWDCYKGSDGEYYVKETVTQKYEPLKFDDGTEIKTGEEHYFKLEPIQWRVLTDNYNGKKLLFAEKALTVFKYDDDSNNYENSQIRAYLNGEFLHKAFSPAQIEKILPTNVDNSADSTIGTGQKKADNKYAGGNTTDKIFLLSLDEITKAEYGFSEYNEARNDLSTLARSKKSTDYTRAMNTWIFKDDKNSNYDKYKDNCDYWLRSPRVPLDTDNVEDSDGHIIQSDLQVQMIGEDGCNGYGGVTSTFTIVPALTL